MEGDAQITCPICRKPFGDESGPAPRDDLESVGWILVYMLEDGDPYFTWSEKKLHLKRMDGMPQAMRAVEVEVLAGEY